MTSIIGIEITRQPQVRARDQGRVELRVPLSHEPDEHWSRLMAEMAAATGWGLPLISGGYLRFELEGARLGELLEWIAAALAQVNDQWRTHEDDRAAHQEDAERQVNEWWTRRSAAV